MTKKLVVPSFLSLMCLSNLAWGFSVENGQIYNNQQQEIHLYGVSWFGFETQDYVLHGLWSRNWQDMVQQIKALGFTAVRIPFCPTTLTGVSPKTINYSANPDLQNLDSLQILDKVIAEFDRQGLYMLLDHHRPDCKTISTLWYTDNYSEQDWINDLVFVAQRYRDVPHIMGIDLKNEPHGNATWGTDDLATDWRLAAQRAAEAIIAVNDNVLIFVEGVGETPVCSSNINHWWGGNLEPVRCYPPTIPNSKLVLTPHVYGPDVSGQPYFQDANFPNNMPAIWEAHFGYLVDEGYTVAIGEFGGRYGHGGDAKDKIWQDTFIDYMLEKGLTHFFYWSWNPNSSDTGGILQDDWNQVWEDKVALLKRLMTETPTSPPDGSSVCKIDYVIESQWQDGLVTEVSLHNQSQSPINGWQIRWTFPTPAEITNSWNATLSEEGNTVIATNESWNKTVPAGGNVSFGMQLQGDDLKMPDNFSLVGETCSVPSPNPSQDYQTGFADGIAKCQNDPASCGIIVADDHCQTAGSDENYAKYELTGKLIIPVVSVPDGLDNQTLWKVQMQLFGQSQCNTLPPNALLFEVVNAEPVNQ